MLPLTVERVSPRVLGHEAWMDVLSVNQTVALVTRSNKPDYVWPCEKPLSNVI
jgi:hypothetical protein